MTQCFRCYAGAIRYHKNHFFFHIEPADTKFNSSKPANQNRFESVGHLKPLNAKLREARKSNPRNYIIGRIYCGRIKKRLPLKLTNRPIGRLLAPPEARFSIDPPLYRFSDQS